MIEKQVIAKEVHVAAMSWLWYALHTTVLPRVTRNKDTMAQSLIFFTERPWKAANHMHVDTVILSPRNQAPAKFKVQPITI